MSKINEVVGNSLEYYDRNYDKYSKFFDKVRYIKFDKTEVAHEQDVINFYDDNRKLLYKSRYEILGTYISASSTWTWAWSVPLNKKNKTQISRKLLTYGTEIEPNVEYIFLKTELITSRYKITNMIQLDLHASIASYLSKQPLIYTYKIPAMTGQELKAYATETDIEKQNYVDVKKARAASEYTLSYLFLLDYKELDNLMESMESSP